MVVVVVEPKKPRGLAEGTSVDRLSNTQVRRDVQGDTLCDDREGWMGARDDGRVAVRGRERERQCEGDGNSCLIPCGGEVRQSGRA